uniref:Uncharacterized protein n=1 Tax=Rhizophora mucronata TaxID=61149 RepID=A0A2P2L3E1_RHIMU
MSFHMGNLKDRDYFIIKQLARQRHSKEHPPELIRAAERKVERKPKVEGH